MKQGWIRLISISLIINWLFFAGTAAGVLATESGTGLDAGAGQIVSLPNVKVPTVYVPDVHEPESEIPSNPALPSPLSNSSGNLPSSSTSTPSNDLLGDTPPANTDPLPPPVADQLTENRLETTDKPHRLAIKTKEWIQKVSKMLVGTRSVLYKAVSNMDDQGRIAGSIWKYANQYVVELALPWIDSLPVPKIDPYAKGTELAGKTKELRKFIETYQSVKQMTTVENGGPRAIGPNFSILGGTASMMIGGYEMFAGLQGGGPLSEQEQTVEFYMGAGDLLSGLGTVAGGIATVVAGTMAAPGLAVAGTVFFAAGILLAAMAYGMKYSPWFRESAFGRGLNRIRRQLAGFLGR